MFAWYYGPFTYGMLGGLGAWSNAVGGRAASGRYGIMPCTHLHALPSTRKGGFQGIGCMDACLRTAPNIRVYRTCERLLTIQ